MPAILPIVAGAAGSALLSKLLDLALSSSTSSPAIDEGSSVAGTGRVYDTPQADTVTAKPSVVITSPNAMSSSPAVSNVSATGNQTAGKAVENNEGDVVDNTGVNDIANQHRQAVMAAENAGEGVTAASEDPATAPINGSDVLNALLAAAGAGGLAYGANKLLVHPDAQLVSARGFPNVQRTPINMYQPDYSSEDYKNPGNEPWRKPMPTDTGSAVVAAPNARAVASNVIDAQYRVVEDPLNIAGGDPTLQLAPPQKKLTSPQPEQKQQQVSGSQNNKALPPANDKVINLPDQTSGPTIQAESGVFDAAKPSQKINLQGKQFVVQDGMIFDGRTKAFLGEASKFIPKNQQGVARTLGILKRGLR